MKKKLAGIMTGLLLLASTPVFATTGEYEFNLYPNGTYDSTSVETKDDNEQSAYINGSSMRSVEVWYKVKKASGGDATRAVGRMAGGGTFTMPYTYSASKGDRLFLNVQNNNTDQNIWVFGRWTP